MRTPFLAAAAALVLAAPPSTAQTTHEDPQGRYAMDLPAGWKLVSEQLDQVYQFAEGDAKIIVYVQSGTADRVAAFQGALEAFCGPALEPPPAGTVFDLDVNGSPARQAHYTFQAASGNRRVPLTVFMGSVALAGTEVSVSFAAILNDNARKKWDAQIPGVFHSIRMVGAPVIAATEPVAVTHEAPTPAPAPAAAAAAPASTFEHALVTLDIPAGWTAQPGQGTAQIVEVANPEFPSLRVIGLAGNDFGKNRTEVMQSMVTGFQSSLPSFNQSSPPREDTTAAGQTILVAEYQGSLVVEGREVPQWTLLAAYKDRRRGLGFVWMVPPAKKDAALAQVLGIIRSAR
jgi:hypothetical protein